MKEIINEERLFEGEEDEENENYRIEDSRYNCKLIIIPFRGEWESQIFSSEEELFKKWPQFHINFVYNWSQKGGKFNSFLGKSFQWKQENDLYSLDPITFDLISDGFTTNYEFGYRDLILTAEAIKNKAWKLLSYKGLKHLEAFLKKFPDSLKKYEKAVYDSYTSSFAKSHNMTTTEFLWWRRDLKLNPKGKFE